MIRVVQVAGADRAHPASAQESLSCCGLCVSLGSISRSPHAHISIRTRCDRHKTHGRAYDPYASPALPMGSQLSGMNRVVSSWHLSSFSRHSGRRRRRRREPSVTTGARGSGGGLSFGGDVRSFGGRARAGLRSTSRDRMSAAELYDLII